MALLTRAFVGVLQIVVPQVCLEFSCTFSAVPLPFFFFFFFFDVRNMKDLFDSVAPLNNPTVRQSYWTFFQDVT